VVALASLLLSAGWQRLQERPQPGVAASR